MPKIFLHYPQGTFSEEALVALTGELSTIGLGCEQIPLTEYGKSTAWIYANEYPPSRVFVGGVADATRVISVEVNAFHGGLDDAAKARLIEGFTAAIAKAAGLAEGQRPPVFIIIRDTPSSDWGIFGKRTSLQGLREPPANSVPV